MRRPAEATVGPAETATYSPVSIRVRSDFSASDHGLIAVKSLELGGRHGIVGMAERSVGRDTMPYSWPGALAPLVRGTESVRNLQLPDPLEAEITLLVC